MTHHYRQLYQIGEFDKLLLEARKDDSDEGRLWQLIACVSLNKTDEAVEIINKYDRNFSDVSDPSLRQSLITISGHIDGSSYHFEQDLFLLFADFFHNNDIPIKDVDWGYKSRNTIYLSDYFIKYVRSPHQIEELRRQHEVLNAIHQKLTVSTPKPIRFAINETNDLAAFIYKKIPGTTTYSDKISISDLLQLILQLQKLHTYPEIKKHLITFTPELDEIEQYLTYGQIKSRYPRLRDQKIESIVSFIKLCADHLPTTDIDRKFVHGDLFLGNIISDPASGMIIGVIDFERCWYADPWIDFAKLSYNDDDLLQLLQLYNETVEQININLTMAKVLLYRGLFILRQMMNTSNYMRQKINMWIVNPLTKINALLNNQKT